MHKVKIKDIFYINKEIINLLEYDFINYLDTGNITQNEIAYLQKLDTNNNKIPSRAKRIVKQNTIIYSSVRPNLNHYGIIRKPEKNMVVSTGFITLDLINEKLFDVNYLYYNLTQDKYTNYLQSIACNNVSSYPSINPSDLENMKITINSNLKVQKQIGNLLFTIDSKIELNNKINSGLESLAKMLYEYWFVQFDFPDEFGRPYKSSGGKMVWNEILKREIPAGWEVKIIKDFVNVITGKKDANFATEIGKYAFFTCGDKILKCNTPEFCGKSILIAGNGNFNVKYFKGKFNAYQRTYVLIPSNEKIIGLMYHSAKSRISSFTKKSNGSIVKFITKGDIENTPIILPKNLSLSNSFNSILEQQNQIMYENEHLSSLRDFLLPLLMNGQVSIKD